MAMMVACSYYNGCMKVIVGLGNPGEIYQKSRHNVGFMVVDNICRAWGDSGQDFKMSRKLGAEIMKYKDWLFVKPQKFMNRSGEVVERTLAFYGVLAKDLVVLHDDLDLVLGSVKAQFGRGPKAHNGVNSIEQALGTKEFWRIRVGVDGREYGQKQMAGKDYVLSTMSDEELMVISQVTEEIVERMLGQLA